MQFLNTIGFESTAKAETVFLCGYNGTGAAVNQYAPVCWDVVASDGRTFKTPATVSFACFAGVVQDTVGTAQYTAKILAYGPTSVRSWGVASTYVPGVPLILTNGSDYVAYGTAGQINGAIEGPYPVTIIALQTNTSVATTVTKAFIRAL